MSYSMVHPHQQPLPVDVLEAIVDQIDDTTSLCCFSITCSIVLPRTRYRLFNSLTIQTLKKLESSLEFFESHPWLRPLVKKLTLSVVLPLDYPHGNIPLLAVVPVHLLSQLPNLRVWCMDVDKVCKQVYLSLHRCTLSRYKRFGSHIQDLKLSFICFNAISDFTGLVSSFTGIHTLTCSCIWFRETGEHVQASQSPLKVSRKDFIARPLKFRNLHLGESVDPRAVEYLLNSNMYGLDSLTLTVDAPGVKHDDYSEHLVPWLSGLSHLSTLTYVILCGSWKYCGSFRPGISLQNTSNHEQILVQGFCRVIEILNHVSRMRVLREARLIFVTDHIDGLAKCISWNCALLKAFNELEQVILTFPRCRVLFYATETEHRGRRAEFWHRIVGRAFPRMDERGRLSFPLVVKPHFVVDSFAHESFVKCLVVSHDSQWVVSASSDGTIIIWDAERGTIVHEWLAHQYPIITLALSPDSRRLVSASGDGPDTLSVWDIGDTICKAASLEGHTEALNACVWSPDGTLIASSDRGAVRVWDAVTFELRDLVLRLNEREPVFVPGSLRFSPNGRHLAWISKSLLGTYRYDNCSIWIPLSGEQPKRLEVRPPRISHRENGYTHALSFHPGSGRVATAYGFARGQPEGSVVRIWDVTTGAVLLTMAGHKGIVTDVSFSADGRSVLSASADGVAKIWDTGSGEETASFSLALTARSNISKARFSPDGKHIAMVSFPLDSKVQLWRIEDGASVELFPEHEGSVEHVVFSPNGEFLVSGDSLGMVYICRVPSFAQH